METDLRLSSDALSIAAVLADTFGFSPTRDAWKPNPALLMREPSDAVLGWWFVILTIDRITAEEGEQFAAALDRAAAWFKDHPNTKPEWVDPRKNFMWDKVIAWASRPEAARVFEDIAKFARNGPFRVTRPEGPDWPYLTRL